MVAPLAEVLGSGALALPDGINAGAVSPPAQCHEVTSSMRRIPARAWRRAIAAAHFRSH